MNEQIANGLKELYHTNGVARAFLDHAAQRTYDQKETKVDTALTNLNSNGPQFSRQDVVELFRRMEGLGGGKFITGRRGQESRFVWEVSLRSAGKAAAGETLSVEEIDDTEAVSRSLQHSYYLRSDRPITVDLPMDLTTKEAERLAAFIKSLPLETEQ